MTVGFSKLANWKHIRCGMKFCKNDKSVILWKHQRNAIRDNQRWEDTFWICACQISDCCRAECHCIITTLTQASDTPSLPRKKMIERSTTRYHREFKSWTANVIATLSSLCVASTLNSARSPFTIAPKLGSCRSSPSCPLGKAGCASSVLGRVHPPPCYASVLRRAPAVRDEPTEHVHHAQPSTPSSRPIEDGTCTRI